MNLSAEGGRFGETSLGWNGGEWRRLGCSGGRLADGGGAAGGGADCTGGPSAVLRVRSLGVLAWDGVEMEGGRGWSREGIGKGAEL